MKILKTVVIGLSLASAFQAFAAEEAEGGVVSDAQAYAKKKLTPEDILVKNDSNKNLLVKWSSPNSPQYTKFTFIGKGKQKTFGAYTRSKAPSLLAGRRMHFIFIPQDKTNFVDIPAAVPGSDVVNVSITETEVTSAGSKREEPIKKFGSRDLD